MWDLGAAELQLASAPPATPSPLYAKHLLHESDTTLRALPEIKHVMRAQDPRPPVAVSLAFTGAVLVRRCCCLVLLSEPVVLVGTIGGMAGGGCFTGHALPRSFNADDLSCRYV